MAPEDLQSIINVLRADPTLYARAPCGHEYRLADSELFHDSDFPPSGQAFLELQNGELRELEAQVKSKRHKLTEGFTKKSVDVKFGKTVEKLVPILQGFPYEPADCRAMFDPVDYVAFVGASRGRVSRIDFIDAKSGQAALSTVQRQVRDAIARGDVRLHGLGGSR